MSKAEPKISPGAAELSKQIDRRTLLTGAAQIAGGFAAATPAFSAVVGKTSESAATGGAGGPTVLASAHQAVVPTTSGQVAGYVREAIFTFKGIPYGDTTAGANRFLPARNPEPWTGIRSSRQYGPVAPQTVRNASPDNDEESFLFRWDDGVDRVYRDGASEDCLRVNVWTPGIVDGGKRPVMVWIHGGKFAYGSGNEQLAYDGENLSRRGDAVVITLNHRLNVFGFLNLARYGEQYASSANLGLLDIVAALEWVRDNVAAFGGDPSSVTIFGQSGGGSKVSMLLGMPAAEGLFHRAIIQSGSMLLAGAEAPSQKLADLVLAELGLTHGTIDKLHTLSYPEIQQASERALRSFMPSANTTDFERLVETWGFVPIMDGKMLPAHPFSPRSTAFSLKVPLLVGSNLNEFVTATGHPAVERMKADELEQRVRAAYGQDSEAILSAFRERTPQATPFDLWSHISACAMRGRAIGQCRAKFAGGAPAFLYWFTWQTPVLDGRPRAFHGAEIPFVFDNTDRCDTMTGGGPKAQALAARMSDCWIQFARAGDPNHRGVPHWPRFSSEDVPTMIFDDQLRLVNNPDGHEQRSIRNATMQRS